MTEESVYALTNDPSADAGSVGVNARRVVCPGCETHYLVAETAFRAAEGRRVRCASCGHTWQYSPQPGAIQPAFLDEMATAKAASGAVPAGEPARLGPLVAAEPLFPARPSAAAVRRKFTGRPGARAAILGASVLAAGLVLFALLGRERVAALYPSTDAVYAMPGVGKGPPEPAGTGLKVTVTPMRSADGLVIKGDIVNGADIPRRVPRLRLTLLDGNKGDLDTKVINPPVVQLGPGATAHFNTVFEHPALAAVRVNVSFATD